MESILKKAQENEGFIYKSFLLENYTEDFKTLKNFCEKNNIFIVDDTNKKSSNLLKLYLQEMAQYPMLTIEEEKAIGEILLDKNSPNREVAREKLINSNLRLVVSIAKKYFYKTPISNLDIIQMGNMGLMTAADKFDVRKGNRFSTVATYWIKQAILRGLSSQSRNIRLPENIVGKLNQLNKCRKDFLDENGDYPSIEELSVLTGFPESEVKLLLEHSNQPLSLSQKISDDTDDLLEDVCADNKIETPEQFFQKQTDREIIDQVLATLGDEREIEIIKQRFGFDDNIEKTWAEIGRNLGISHTRAEQIFKKALKKLSSPARKKILKEQFYGN